MSNGWEFLGVNVDVIHVIQRISHYSNNLCGEREEDHMRLA